MLLDYQNIVTTWSVIMICIPSERGSIFVCSIFGDLLIACMLCIYHLGPPWKELSKLHILSYQLNPLPR